MAFEVIIFITVLWNGLDRPRLKDEALASRLYRDGVLFFVMLFGAFMSASVSADQYLYSNLAVLRVVNLTIGAIGAVSVVVANLLVIWLILCGGVAIPPPADDIVSHVPVPVSVSGFTHA